MAHENWWLARSLFATVLLWGNGAAAVDGVIEINQAKADAGGVNGSLVDDPAGFPVVIKQPGRYRLTGDLTVPDIVTAAIHVTVAHVDIDLNGFAILGPNTYGGPPGSCSFGTTNGVGIHSTSPSVVGVRVHDGTVKGMGSTGVHLEGRGEISHVNAQENGGSGLVAGNDSIISANRAILNCTYGIFTGTSSSVRENVVSGNRFDGIQTGARSSVADNAVTGNGSCGFNSAFPGSASNNTVLNNPPGCAGSCCSIVGLSLLSCNLVQNAAGTVQRCCPNPPNPDICY